MAKTAKNKPKKIEDKIKDVKQQLIANSKDGEWAKKMLAHLTSLQKQADIETVELIVPTKDVIERIDFGSFSIARTSQGYLFEAKGGLSTFVSLRMQAVCDMIQYVFEMYNNPSDDEEQKKIADSYMAAVGYIMQTPIFASLNEMALYDIAANILRAFNEYVANNVNNAELKEETEEDIKANIEAENIAKAVEMIVETPNKGVEQLT